MSEILQVAILALLAVTIALLIWLSRRRSTIDISAIVSRLDASDKGHERTERAVREQGGLGREEQSKAAREQRQELIEGFKALTDSVATRMAESASSHRAQLDTFSETLGNFAKASGERLDAARSESASGAKQLREEVVTTLKTISDTMVSTLRGLATAEKAQLEAFSEQLAALTKTTSERLDGIRSESAAGAKQLREEVVATLNGITGATTKTMGELANTQKGQLEVMSSTIANLSTTNESRLEALRITVEARLQSIQVENTRQLDQMRQTVDEKLQGTLEKRLGESFRQVSERLELVHKGLGEMQVLATGVGDLKKVLSNVKTRGTWGEVQLGALLEQVLSPDQFASNVGTKEGGERVEFAITLPGQGTNRDETVLLPIDAKFPIEDYYRLVDAQERVDPEGVERAGKQLEAKVRACARDITEKYLNPPKTTDFGILFLPTEGLFAEVIRRPGLLEVLQRESRVVVAGPTTLWSILSSLQMGFRTLAIQKRSSEVWNLLASIKTEWTKYGDALELVQTKLHQASETVEKAKVRSRAVDRKLRGVHTLPVAELTRALPHKLLGNADGGGAAED